MIVVSDTSPVLALAAVGHLALLESLYRRVILPEAVFRELCLVDSAWGRSIHSYPWMEVCRVADTGLVKKLLRELDPGEAEAIALTVELQADLLLIDEREGRKIARRMGLPIVGLLGILVEAKIAGLAPALKPILDDLMAKAGFWIGEELYARVLRQVGEQK